MVPPTLLKNNEPPSTGTSYFVTDKDCSKGLVNNELAEGETRGKQAFILFQCRNDGSMTWSRSRSSDKRKQ